MKLFKIIIFVSFLFLGKLYSQEKFDGYLLCMDNLNIGDQNTNQYYYLPYDYSKANISFDKETIEHEDDKLELKIRAVNGYKLYKNIYNFQNDVCISNNENDLNYYSDINFKLAYFHYKDSNFVNIKKEYFLKKIKKNKFYLARIKFKGCKLIDKNYLKSKVLKIFVYSIDEIIPVKKEEKDLIVKFIKNAYCR